MRRSPIQRALASRVPIALIAASIGISLVSEVLIHVISDDYLMIVMGIGMFVLAATVVVMQDWIDSFSSRRGLEISERPAAPARVLIVTASQRSSQRSPAGRAIEHHAEWVRKVFVLHTEDERGFECWLGLLDEVASLGRPALTAALVSQPVSAGAVDDPRPTYDLLLRLFDQAVEDGYDQDDIVFDYTGGTKAFTAAMTLAGAEGLRRLQYVAPARDAHGVMVPGTYVPIEIDLRFRVRPQMRWQLPARGARTGR